LNPRFAVVDVEATGGKPENDRIIEIGVVLVDDWKITEKFHSLVKVSRDIPPFIVNLTGITPKMLENAPTFEDLAPRLDKMLADRIFVAHNVAFDSSFVCTEMKRAGFDCDPEKLCTVKLSRRVFAGQQNYSLHRLASALGIPDFTHHRALGDALAAAQLLILAYESGGLAQIAEQIRGGKKPAFYPKGWNDESIADVPRTPGILYFMGKDEILYETFARNRRERVLALLSNARKGPLKGLAEGIYDIKTKDTGSELLARLCVEVELFKHRYPCNCAVAELSDSGAPIPDMAVFLPGRFQGDKGVVVVRGGKVQGYTFLSEDGCYSLSDVLEKLIPFPQELNLIPILRPALQKYGVRAVFLH